MGTALFISLNELKKNTAISGNIDANKLLPAIKTAQQLELENVLGTDLYNKLSLEISGGTISGDYLILKQDYIHDVLIHFAVSYYLPFASYQILNGGVAKWEGGDNFSSIESSELSMMVNKEKALGESYKKRLIDYLCANSALYPEYTSNSDADDIHPSSESNVSGLYLN
jgi:hypothetical protein